MTREMFEKTGTIGGTLGFLKQEISKMDNIRQCNKNYYLKTIDETMVALYELRHLLERIHN